VSRFGLSLLATLAESGGWLLIPLVIGHAIDEFLGGSLAGLVLLTVVGLTTVALVVLRRIHDTRLYSRIYERAGADSNNLSTSLSARTARLNMLREVIDFAEYSMPLLIECIVILVGSLVFLVMLNPQILIGIIVVVVLTVLIYAVSTRRTLSFNRYYNDEYEKQVDILEKTDAELIRNHVKKLNRWTIKLSDIDALNFGLSFSLAIGLLVFSIVSSATSGVPYGSLFSIVLYALEFSAAASLIPNAWQESLRLREILSRLRTKPGKA